MENISAGFLEYEVDFDNYDMSGNEILAATITRPKQDGRYPAVLIVPGAGNTDRDGTLVSLDIHTNMYLDLAYLAAELGFVTMRYDKRGVGASQGEREKTGMWDLVDDIISAVSFLKEQPFVDPENIILLGHSEGSMLATAANAKDPVSGLILISNACETLEESSKWQREQSYKEFNTQRGFKGVSTRLMRIQPVDKVGEKDAEKFYKKIMESSEDTIKHQSRDINAKWFREHFQHDLFGDLEKVTCPVLAIVGDKDFQSDPENVSRICDYVKSDAKVCVIANMDHIMKEYEEEYKPSRWKQNYKEAEGKPLHPELVSTITEWLTKNYK